MHNSNPEPVSVRPVRGILRGKIHRVVAVWPAVTQALSSRLDEQRLCDLQEVTSPGAALCLVRPDKPHAARSVAAARFRRGRGSGSDHGGLPCSAAGHASRHPAGSCAGVLRYRALKSLTSSRCACDCPPLPRGTSERRPDSDEFQHGSRSSVTSTFRANLGGSSRTWTPSRGTPWLTQSGGPPPSASRPTPSTNRRPSRSKTAPSRWSPKGNGRSSGRSRPAFVTSHRRTRASVAEALPPALTWSGAAVRTSASAGLVLPWVPSLVVPGCGVGDAGR